VKSFRIIPTLLLSSLLVLTSLFFVGCNKEEEKNPNVMGQISWKINGSTFTADVLAYADKRQQSQGGEPEVTIRASTNKETMNLNFYPATAPGQFVAGGNDFTYNAIAISLTGKQYLANNSNKSSAVIINVTELTSIKIKGTFDGTVSTLSGEKVAASGSFDVAF
jgi:hypothetical protein